MNRVGTAGMFGTLILTKSIRLLTVPFKALFFTSGYTVFRLFVEGV
jgi:hypothetical protein